jgi:uncharacterized protein YndB with AHSA1/START domain
MNTDPNNALTIVRVLNAPPEKVWRACRDIDALRQWWGLPDDGAMLSCTVDFRVGGALHIAVKQTNKPPIWFKSTYLEIVEGERLVLEQHLSDETGSERDSPDWPASMITLRLEPMDGKTKLTVTHAGMVSRIATLEDFTGGWSQSLGRLAGCLAGGWRAAVDH